MNFLLIESELNTMDLLALIASNMSIILGIIAIYLSILFYRMSEKMSRENERVSKSIETTIDKLEDVFNKLYTGTFDMMKDTVTDMRKHVYKQIPTETKATRLGGTTEETYLKAAVSEMSDEIKKITSGTIGEKDIKKILAEIVTRSKKIQAEIHRTQIRNEILHYLKFNKKVTYGALTSHFNAEYSSLKESLLVFNEVRALALEGVINNAFEMERDGGISISHAARIYIVG